MTLSWLCHPASARIRAVHAIPDWPVDVGNSQLIVSAARKQAGVPLKRLQHCCIALGYRALVPWPISAHLDASMCTPRLDSLVPSSRCATVSLAWFQLTTQSPRLWHNLVVKMRLLRLPRTISVLLRLTRTVARCLSTHPYSPLVLRQCDNRIIATTSFWSALAPSRPCCERHAFDTFMQLTPASTTDSERRSGPHLRARTPHL